MGALVRGVLSVSYTHLDVYKRQDSYVTELKKKQMRLTYEDGISDKEPKDVYKRQRDRCSESV